MKYKIVLVPFPFDDLKMVKARPAICLTEKISIYNHVVIAFITSNTIKADEKSDLLILKSEKDFHKTGLKTSSAVRLHRLTTIPVRMIKRELGVLPNNYKKLINTKLKEMFGL